MPALAHAGDDDLARALGYQLHHPVQRIVQLGYDVQDGVGLIAQASDGDLLDIDIIDHVL